MKGAELHPGYIQVINSQEKYLVKGVASMSLFICSLSAVPPFYCSDAQTNQTDEFDRRIGLNKLNEEKNYFT